MRKITEIQIKSNYIIECTFNNKEVRDFNIEKSLDLNNKYNYKLYNQETFKNAKVGNNGELYWEGIGEIKSLSGILEPCNYDFCPDFVYLNSENSAHSIPLDELT
jgi:Protein of unknown function (DUF2442)